MNYIELLKHQLRIDANLAGQKVPKFAEIETVKKAEKPAEKKAAPAKKAEPAKAAEPKQEEKPKAAAWESKLPGMVAKD